MNIRIRTMRKMAAGLALLCLLQPAQAQQPPNPADVLYVSDAVTLTRGDVDAMLLRGGPRGARQALIVECNGIFGFATIQSAINAAEDGDIVVVLPNNCNPDGRYVENIDFLGKAIRLQSAFPTNPDIVAATIIDGNQSGPVVRLENSKGQHSILDGLTITNGTGIFCQGADATISNCRIVGNTGGLHSSNGSEVTLLNCELLQNIGFSGGAVSSGNSDLTLVDCRLRENVASSSGGAIRHVFGSLNLIRCCFETNHSNGTGGAIDYLGQGDGLIVQCNFVGNSSSSGGAIYSMNLAAPESTSRLEFRNCAFVGNVADRWGGGYKNAIGESFFTNCLFVGNCALEGGGLLTHAEGLALTNSILWYNRDASSGSETQQVGNQWPTIMYSDIQGLDIFAGNGNIGDDPRFVDLGHWDDAGTPGDLSDDVFVPGDYHLLPDSPCSDAGDPNFVAEDRAIDFDGEPRIMGCRVDMGVDEFTRDDPPLGDFDDSGMVDAEDVPAFVAALLNPTLADVCVGDLNQDEKLDGRDIAEFLFLLLQP